MSNADLKEYIPDFLLKINEFMGICVAEEKQLSDVNEIISDTELQFALSTATWGLIYWEREYGVKTDENLTYEQRRDIVRAKIRGNGTCTIELIKSIINAYFISAKINENYDEGVFSCLFEGKFDDEVKRKSLDASISAVRPAHLNFDLRYQENVDGIGYVGSYVDMITHYTFEQAAEEDS